MAAPTYTGFEMGEPSTRLDSYRQRLLEERERVVAALDYLHEENAKSLGEESEEATFADNIGETATVTLDREMDYSLEEASNHVLGAIDAALERIDAGTYGACTTCGGRSATSASRRSRTRRSASTAAARRSAADA